VWDFLCRLKTTVPVPHFLWNTLPGDIQNALLEAGRDTNRHLCTAMNEGNEEALSEMKQKGAEFYEILTEEQERWLDAVQPLIDQWAEGMKDRGLSGEQAIQEMSEAVETVHKEE
jgi:TRAP-type C4-dicarboxylate transport system substrate-binding protein